MKKLAIVGSHPDTRQNAPFDDASFDIWVMNEAPQSDWCKRWTASFQMHKPEIYTSPNNRSNAGHWDWLQQKRGIPVYMQDVDPLVPDSVRYPLEAAQELAGVTYFTSSFAYALALAILEDYEQIDIYGSDLVSNTEYSYQADCFRFWVGVASGHGIQVNMMCWPTAFVAPLYGYDGELQFGQEFYTTRAVTHENAWKAADKNLRNIKAAIQRDILARDWKKVQDNILPYQTVAQDAGLSAGAMSEAQRYADYGQRAIYRQEYEQSMAQANIDGDKKRVSMLHMGGMIEYVWNICNQTNNPKAAAQLLEFILTMGGHAYDTGAMKGIYQENAYYMARFDKLVQAAGGVKSLEVVTGAVI